MNTAEVKTVTQNGVSKLLYTHDGGFTRHVVELYGSKYLCRVNESVCFVRGTHQRMLQAAGFNASNMTAVTRA